MYAMKLNLVKIRKEMKSQKLRPADLARRLGARDQWVFAVLAGRAGRTFKVVDKLAKALNIPEKDLVE